MTKQYRFSIIVGRCHPRRNDSRRSRRTSANDPSWSFQTKFLNRIDDTILFTPLSLNNVKGIVDKMISHLAHRLEHQEIILEISDEAKTWIAENAYEPHMAHAH